MKDLTFEALNAKIKMYKEKGLGKKNIHYPTSLKKEVSKYLKSKQMTFSEFSQNTGLAHSTISRQQRAYKFSQSTHKESLFYPLSIEESSSLKKVWLIKGLSIEEMIELIREL